VIDQTISHYRIVEKLCGDSTGRCFRRTLL